MTSSNNPPNMKMSLPDHTQLPESDSISSNNQPPKIFIPDHTHLPESNGTFVNSFQYSQSSLLTDSIQPVLDKIHPEKQYCIGQSLGIYWRIAEPLERGAVAPDWCYFPHILPTLDGEIRRSYFLWGEAIPPSIVIEFVLGDGSVERDKTPFIRGENESIQTPGKFWVYERVIRPVYYAIYEVQKPRLEVYQLIHGDELVAKYELIEANERGHYPISDLGVELGIWSGSYQNMELPWLRWWDNEGNLLTTSGERLETTELLLAQESQKAEQERQRAEKLAEKLRAMGIDPEE
ncbi:MAG: Uma2 family endonuclease [Okeania sp. SIO3H1]|uniref:Uma2 family endonuclease n=1 Tax=Okeania sp. SIO1I7 TaxID=2607772 RepID=UPI0013C9EA88|nr:Uma2 family endonuclease [Okeania sp. SIO1I7]NEN91396.1 Uma2 family endonuclease [Okeania sp. SIO3H1]NET29246.1 Uma2 family endonuclease [Okeania sp. SIO1I7]